MKLIFYLMMSLFIFSVLPINLPSFPKLKSENFSLAEAQNHSIQLKNETISINNNPFFLEKPAAKKTPDKSNKKFDWSKISNILRRIRPIFGMISFIFAIIFLIYNELKAVARQCFIINASNTCMELPSDNQDPNFIDKLVLISGKCKTKSSIVDPDTGISISDSLRLYRKVEIFNEKKDEKPSWNEEINDLIVIKSQKFDVKDCYLGDFEITEREINEFKGIERVYLQLSNLNEIENNLSILLKEDQQLIINDNYLYIKKGNISIKKENIGDLRISYYRVPCGECSIMAGRTEKGFDPYDIIFKTKPQTKKDFRHIYWIHDEKLIKQEIFEKHDLYKSKKFWFWRIFCFVLAVLGLFLFLLLFKSSIQNFNLLKNLGSWATLVFSLLIVSGVFLFLEMILWGFAKPLISVICGIGIIVIALIFFKMFRKPKSKNSKTKGKGKKL